MIRRAYRRYFDRFLDRGDEVFLPDADRVAWIREHEPHKLRPVAFATPRNARRALQLGLFLLAVSVWFVSSGIWLPDQYDNRMHWFAAGLMMGGGASTVGASRLFAYLAYLRGESGNRPRSDREEATSR